MIGTVYHAPPDPVNSVCGIGINQTARPIAGRIGRLHRPGFQLVVDWPFCRKSKLRWTHWFAGSLVGVRLPPCPTQASAHRRPVW